MPPRSGSRPGCHNVWAAQLRPYDGDNGDREEDPLLDRETWGVLFEDAVKDNPETADSLAHLCCDILKAIGDGPEEIERATRWLKCGLEWVYPYTADHKMAFKAFIYYVEGLLLSPWRPEAILKEAIDQAEQHVAVARDSETGEGSSTLGSDNEGDRPVLTADWTHASLRIQTRRTFRSRSRSHPTEDLRKALKTLLLVKLLAYNSPRQVPLACKLDLSPVSLPPLPNLALGCEKNFRRI